MTAPADRKAVTTQTGCCEARVSLQTLSESVIHLLISEHYGFEATTPLVPIEGGLESKVWSIKTVNGNWLLKIFGAHEGSLERIREEALLYERLNERGLQAPHVMPTLKGDKVAQLPIDGAVLFGLLMRSERLHQREARNIDQREIGIIASAQARMHEILRSNRSAAKLPLYRPTTRAYRMLLESPYAAILSKEELAVTSALDRKMVNYAEQFKQEDNLSQSLLHGDMRLEHAPFLPSGEVYFFDFADRSWGLVSHCIAVMLAHLYCDEEISFERWDQLVQWYLAGYSSVVKLTQDDRAAIKPLIIIRLLDEIAYLSERAKQSGSLVDPEGIRRRYRLGAYLLGDYQGQSEYRRNLNTAVSPLAKAGNKNFTFK